VFCGAAPSRAPYAFVRRGRPVSPAQGLQGTTLQLRRTIAASREAVFRAWTDPDWFRQWFGPRDVSIPHVDLDVRVDGDYRVDFESAQGTAYLFGKYLEVKRPERIVYTFCWGGAASEIAETVVSVDFHERGSETEVVITHERQPSPAAREFHEMGWTVSLERLAELLERAAAESP
jgi:uncharacterized protein YndB with AHSA1/START domain